MPSVSGEMQGRRGIDSCATAWLVGPLLSEEGALCGRDFFQYSFLREDGGRSLPHWEGHLQAGLQAIDETEAFGRWCQGCTGFPFVDASMRELATTGYMGNRSRQNVASILTKVRAAYNFA